ncbi:MAG: hypothetical protein U5K54_10275 [Cytophagales bacterium]|nr:hypothetical protein [Cytophagales bacterium]
MITCIDVFYILDLGKSILAILIYSIAPYNAVKFQLDRVGSFPGNGEIVQLNFGTDILSNPVVEGNYSFSGVNNPYKVKLTQEGDAYFAIVSNETNP